MRTVVLQSLLMGEPTPVQLERMDGRERACYAYCIGENQSDDRSEIEAIEITPGQGWLRIQDQVVAYHAVRRGPSIHVWIDGDVYRFDIVDRTARRASADGTSEARERLVAPMPGTILKVEVAAGDSFDAHQPLIIMESMKMETTLSVPHAGRIVDVRCKPGELVEMGAVLANVEALDGDAAS